MKRFLGICIFSVCLCGIAQAQIPTLAKQLLPADTTPTLDQLVAARNVLSASATLRTVAANKIVDDNASTYEQFRKIRIYIEQLQMKLIELNNQIVQLDQQRKVLFDKQKEEHQARQWVDEQIQKNQDAGIPKDVTDVVQHLLDLGVLKE